MRLNQKFGQLTMVIGISATIAVLSDSICPAQVSQPQSTFSVADDKPYMPYVPSGTDHLILETKDVPKAECPDDSPDGEPLYYWDFGTLNGQDQDDGTMSSSTSGKADDPEHLWIVDDTSGSYNVTVYCIEWFDPADGGDAYPEQTQTSD